MVRVAASLLLGVLLAVAWVCSFDNCQRISFRLTHYATHSVTNWFVIVESATGQVGLDADRQFTTFPATVTREWRLSVDNSVEPPHEPGGRGIISYWPLLLLVGAALLHALMSYMVRSYRRENRLCGCCGYDLRASSGRCPECGAETASKTMG